MNEDEFLNKLYEDITNKKLHLYSEKSKDLSVKKKRVKEYFDKLDRVQTKIIKKNKVYILKELYYRRYVIKREDIPETYFKKMEQMYLEKGCGRHYFSDEEKDKIANTIITDQKKSLDDILDYFLSEDSRFYPMSLKYWAFQGLINIGEYNKETKKFQRRTSKTINKFIDFNIEALSLAIDTMSKMLNGEKVLNGVLKTDSFIKLYNYFFNNLDNINKDKVDSIRGNWVKYEQGSDPVPLVCSLQGKGTGWCTVGEETARKQLEDGDFYVYYSADLQGDYTNPRIAIRMNGSNQIEEIRGVAYRQNMEPELMPVLEEKLKEFPDSKKYRKKVRDMEKLTEIYNKFEGKKELSKEDLRFLYQIDTNILGFGHRDDVRIYEILRTRNKIADLTDILECTEDEIAFTEFEFKNSQMMRKRIKYFGSSLYINNLNATNLILPEIVKGDLIMSQMTKAESLVFPRVVCEFLFLKKLPKEEFYKVQLPEYVGEKIITSFGNFTLDELVEVLYSKERIKR